MLTVKVNAAVRLSKQVVRQTLKRGHGVQASTLSTPTLG